MKKLKYIIIPIILGAVFVYGFDKYLDIKNKEFLKSKSLYTMLHDTKSLVKDKGVFANNQLLKNEYIMFMGSSELSHSTRQHPDYYFDTGRTKHGAISIGRAYTQNLQHATILGSTDSSIKDKRVVLLLSMQWFMEPNGVRDGRFLTRFSPVQFYNYLDNPRISKDLKIKFANRVGGMLMKKPGEFKPEALYAQLYVKNDPLSKTIKLLLKPYYMFRSSMVSLKDKGITLGYLKKCYDKSDVNYDISGNIDWKKEKKDAIEDAKIRVGNKPEYLGGKRIYLDKGYYKEYVKGKDKYFKNLYSKVDLLNTKEYEDFEIFLETCKELGVDPTIVLLPTSNEFYNYTGITQKKRDAYIENVKNIVKPYGFKVLDLTPNSSKKYYLRDVMHLGTLGWVDLCQKLYNIYEK